jgi:hypothetical protein
MIAIFFIVAFLLAGILATWAVFAATILSGVCLLVSLVVPGSKAFFDQWLNEADQ